MKRILFQSSHSNGVVWWRFMNYFNSTIYRLSRDFDLSYTRFPIFDNNMISSLSKIVSCVPMSIQELQWFKYAKSLNPNIKICVMYDDDIYANDIPDHISAKDTFLLQQNQIKGCLDIADQIITTTELLKKTLSDRFQVPIDKIVCVPNLLDVRQLPPINSNDILNRIKDAKNGSHKIRIGICATGNHVTNRQDSASDFDIISSLVRQTCDKYEWVIIGSIPKSVEDLMKEQKVIFLPGTPIDNWFRFIGSLGMDLMVAPLVDCTFNKCKSMIKVKEAYSLGIPCFVSDIGTYDQLIWDDLFKFKTADDLSYKLNEWLNKSDAYHQKSIKRGIEKLTEEFQLDGNTWDGYILNKNLKKLDEVFLG